MFTLNSTRKETTIAENRCETIFNVKKCRLLWTIEHYSTFATAVTHLRSSPFSSEDDDFKWHLKHSMWRSLTRDQFVLLHLCPENIADLHKSSPVSGNITISILKPDGSIIKTEKKFFKISANEGTSSYTIWSMYLEEMIQMAAFQNKLIIRCELAYLKVQDVFNISTVSISSLSNGGGGGSDDDEISISQDLERFLYTDKTFADLIVTVQNKQCYLHKAILAARSTVFHAMMLENNTNESEKNQIVVTDMSTQCFEEIIFYIYTGKTKDLDKYVFEVFPAAHQYALKELKSICEGILLKKLSMKNAARILLLADTYKAYLLKKLTLQFIKLNNLTCQELKKTGIWTILMETRPHLMGEMLNAFK